MSIAMPSADDPGATMAALRRQFIARCLGDRAVLGPWCDGDGAGPADREGLRRMAHRLAGAAGVFGYPELSRAAMRVEDAAAGGDEPEVAALRPACSALAARIAALAAGG